MNSKMEYIVVLIHLKKKNREAKTRMGKVVKSKENEKTLAITATNTPICFSFRVRSYLALSVSFAAARHLSDSYLQVRKFSL